MTVRGERSRFFGPDATYVAARQRRRVERNLESDFFYKRIIDTQVDREADGAGAAERAAARGQRGGARLRRGLQPLPARDRRRRTCPTRRAAARSGCGRSRRSTSTGASTSSRCSPRAASRSTASAARSRRAPGGAGARRRCRRGRADRALGDAAPARRHRLERLRHRPRPDRQRQGHAARQPALPVGRLRALLPGAPHDPRQARRAAAASLFGVPVVLIGHTRGLAWSHTVSTAFRFTPFELTLVPGSPTTYLVDGQPKQMERDEVTVQVTPAPTARSSRGRGRSTRPQYGPIFTSLLGCRCSRGRRARRSRWATPTRRTSATSTTSSRRTSPRRVREYDQVLRRNQGIPWVNSIAADSHGRGVLRRHLGRPARDRRAGAARATPRSAPRRSRRCGCRCSTARARPATGARDPSAVAARDLGPAEHLPSMFRTDYIMNANDSYWLSQPRSSRSRASRGSSATSTRRARCARGSGC